MINHCEWKLKGSASIINVKALAVWSKRMSIINIRIIIYIIIIIIKDHIWTAININATTRGVTYAIIIIIIFDICSSKITTTGNTSTRDSRAGSKVKSGTNSIADTITIMCVPFPHDVSWRWDPQCTSEYEETIRIENIIMETDVLKQVSPAETMTPYGDSEDAY